MSHSSNLTQSPTNIAFCSAIFSEGTLPTKRRVVSTVVLCLVNALSSVVATTANMLVLWAIKKTPSLHNPSSALLCVLAASDCAVGALIQPLAVISLIGLLTGNFPVYCITGTIRYPLGIFLGGVSLMTIVAISFDRYLALTLHLRYTTIVTVSRVIACILPVCAVLLTVAIMSFWFWTENWFRSTVQCVSSFVTAVCIIAIPIAYCKIFAILRRHKKQIQQQNAIATRMQRFSQINISKYRKSVLVILYLLGAIIVSYLPGAISIVILWRHYTDLSRFVLRITGTIVLLNSSINPLVYCWRIKEIRQFVASKLRRGVFGACVPNTTVDVIQVVEVNPG